MRIGSLCTGYGGLDLAVHSLLGGELAWLSEFDKNAAKVCEARFPGVTNLGDLTAVDWSTLEPVDVLTAGYPCQPFSHAGKRQGTDDARHIWPHIRDALRVLRPRLAVFENVAGHLSLGFDTVLADLAELGFDAEWTVVRASDVGACHQRKRLFILATGDARHGSRSAEHGEQSETRPVGSRQSSEGTTTDAGLERRPQDRGGAPGEEGRERSRRGHHQLGRDGEAGSVGGRVVEPAPPDAEHDGSDGSSLRRGAGQSEAEGRLPQPQGRGSSGLAWGDYLPAIERHARVAGRPAPSPTDDRGRLSAHFVEWMMCLPVGWVTDILPRNPALKALGNGVVPPQAAYAIGHLLDRLDEAEAA